MKQIKEVEDFGAIAAEDDDLERFFVHTPVYDQLLSGERQVVIGRKGSGKTALYLALIDRADETTFFAEGLTFSDYPWALHNNYAHEATTRHARFTASWKFLTALEIFKVLLTEGKRRDRYKKNADAIEALDSVEEFIQKNWGIIAFDHKKTFPSGGFKLDGLSFAPQAAGFALGGLSIDRDGGRLGETLDRLNDWLWNALEAVAPDAPPVYILFDELDAGYDPESEDYVDRVIGLLLGTRSMSRDLRNMGAHFYPIAFLRSDIYDILHFGDKNKLTDANVATLSWNTDLQHHGASLKQLIDHRIRESLQLPNGVTDPWRSAFDDDVMRGTQHKFHHICFRTYRRPRDVIKFANCALDEYKQRVRVQGNGGGKIGNRDIIDARDTYSRYLMAELDDEIAEKEPQWSQYTEVLREIKVTKFEFSAFKRAYRKVKNRAELDRPPLGLLSFFYEYSIVGFERATGASGLEWHFKYQDEKIRFNPEARSFRIHRGLKEALEVSETGEPVN